MQKLLREYLDELNKRNRKSKRAAIAAAILVVMVVGGVVSILTQYGVAMTGTPECGYEEHQHSEECYTESLICGLEEAEGHIHTEECRYPEELFCGLEEQEGEEEGHIHVEECYAVPEGWACGLEETEGHTHTDDCYTKELTCGKEEHIHEDSCYTNASADVEEQEAWDQMYAGVEWKDNWAQDLVTAANMQIGYQESIHNYIVAEDGSHKGYSRYGHFAGDMYADWDAAFVNFCIYYAGIGGSGLFPSETDTEKWCDELVKIRQESGDSLTAPDGYEPQTGDIVFFQRESEETESQMGIVSSYNKETNEIKVIEGNINDEVKENTYSADDADILHYLKTTELESFYKDLGDDAATADLNEEDTTSNGTRNQGRSDVWTEMGPDEAYVNEIKVTGIATGSAPFDDTEGRGNDTTADDKLVRTFDTVTYNFNVNMKSWDISKSYAQARVKLEFALPLSEGEAVFEQTAMAWMDQTEGYKPIVTTETRTINGEEKECQVLTCYKLLLPSEGNHSVVPGDFGENVTIYVRSMKNGEKFAPIISAAMEGGAWDGPCENEEHKIEEQPAVEKKTVIPEEVEVTAAPKYNIRVKGSSSYADDFNFQGDEAWMNQYKDIAANTDIVKPLPGRAMVLGITLQLYNDNASKGLKGIELPDGSDITFDLRVSSKYTINTPNEGYQKDQEIVDSAYAPLLWSYNEVDWKEYGSQNKDGRQIDDRLKATPYAPYNSGGGINACYSGGAWTATQEGDTIHITVKDYKIDPQQMPTLNADEGKEVTYGANVGCFSSGELWLIQPFNKKEGDGTKPNYDIVNTYGPGFFATTAEASNLQVTTVSGETLIQGQDGFQQMVTDDDRETRTLELTLEGGIQNRVRYADKEIWELGCGVMDNRDGRDYAAVGAELNLMGGLSYDPNRVKENQMYLGTTLLKFYGGALELEKEDWFLDLEGGASLNGYDETNTDEAEKNVRFYYATKRDGSDWKSDYELQHTYEDELEFYDSLEKIPEGKTCVGMLISFVGPGSDPTKPIGDPYYRCYHKARVRNNPDLAGQTFMLASTSRLWTERMFEEAGMTLDDINLEKHPDLNVPNLILGEKLWNCGHYTSANIGDDVFYKKETYRADGSGIEGTHNSDWYHWGDTLLIIGYKTKITKNLLQKDANGEEKTTFNLDADQRVADFKLEPGTYYDQPGEFKDKARITIVDTLPKHMTYKPGSAYFGGKYEQTSTLGGTKGNIVKDEDEKADFPKPELTEPKVKNNEDGTQTLTWIIEDVTIGDPMATIYYSVDIGVKGNPEKDIPIGTTNLENTAYITTPRDLRDPETTAEKHAQAGITVTRGSASSFGKYTKQKVVDEDGAIDYVVYFNNNAETGTWVTIMDTMPMNGVNGSHFTGTYRFAEWKLDTEKCDVSKLKIYYSFDTKYKGKTTKEVKQEEIEGWKEAAINSDGTIEIPTEADGATKEQPYPVAWAVIGALDPGKSVNVDLKIQLDPGASDENKEENNYFVNWLSSGDTTTTTETPTVRRILEGLTWMDYNQNGIQNDPKTEVRISGVKVELLKLKDGGDPKDENSYESVYYPNTDPSNEDNKIIIETGQQISVRAKSKEEVIPYAQGELALGRYRFTDLPAGIFAVRFTDGSGDPKITELNATEPDCGTDDTLDSDGVPVYDDDDSEKLLKTVILNLEMPKAEDMSVSLYESKNHDSGFYPNTLMKLQKVDESGNNQLSGAIFTIQDSQGKTVSFTYDEEKGYKPFKEKEAEEVDPSLEGKYYIEFAADPSYVLGISGEWDGAETVLQKKSDNPLQLFEVREYDGDLRSFFNIGSGKWLDLDAGRLENGAKIHVWSNNEPNDNQKWHVTPSDAGSYIWPSIAANASSWRIDLSGGTPSEWQKIHLWEANDSSAQKWILSPAGGSVSESDVETQTELNMDGILSIRNMIPGNYTLTEIKSPKGYSLLDAPVSFNVEIDGTITVQDGGMASVGVEDGKNIVLKVKNERLYELPKAGGTGIYWYMIGGVLLMMTAALVSYRNKRREVLGS